MPTYPAGTRFDYTVSWTNSALGEVYEAGVITASQVAQWVADEISKNGSDLQLESSSGGSYLALLKGGNNVTLSFITVAPFSSQSDMQNVADALVINGLGSYGNFTSSSIQSVTLPGGVAQSTGAPPPGGQNLPNPKQPSLWDYIFGTQATSTKIIEGIVVVLIMVILLVYFFPAQGLSAARTIRS